MKRKLAIEDIRAIDLLLDRGAVASHAPAGNAVYAGADPGMHDRVQAAQKLLHLLDAFDAAEPAADLVTRTMQHIDAMSFGETSASNPISLPNAANGPLA